MKNHFRQIYATDREDVIAYLEAVKQGFNEGTLSFSENNREVRIWPPEYVGMTVETCDQKGTVHFSINFTWATDPEAASKKDS
jgi:amphi-Trp domain-containing protein